MKIVQLMIQRITNIQIFQQLEQVMQLKKGVYWTLRILKIIDQNVYKYSPKQQLEFGNQKIELQMDFKYMKITNQQKIFCWIASKVQRYVETKFGLIYLGQFHQKFQIARTDLTIKLRDYINSKKIRMIQIK
ncbi:unnamed protein product [Paramecium pentaurelia]|uniref:Uncharacterized protein n=1 Tax=Paramecium pentaurelia TaxID=43138 RepID=A0A8S1XN71_9CILI|nr:unnamed protein product [Paramecium pentaurelia]